jgi:oxygen-independent coproporphyrinogen-3 oxidase
MHKQLLKPFMMFRKFFENISIDLIFNLPKQTKEKWIHNLHTAVPTSYKNISAYSIILEHGTFLTKMFLEEMWK